MDCKIETFEHAIYQIMRQIRLRRRLYSDFESAVTAVFSGHPTPILLPRSTIIQLIKENRGWFENTIYESNIYYVYQFGAVHIVLPIKFGNIGYVLG